MTASFRPEMYVYGIRPQVDYGKTESEAAAGFLVHDAAAHAAQHAVLVREHDHAITMAAAVNRHAVAP